MIAAKYGIHRGYNKKWGASPKVEIKDNGVFLENCPIVPWQPFAFILIQEKCCLSVLL